jgi:hypothetical protein
VSLLRNLGRTQACDAGWALYNEKYVTYSQFKRSDGPTGGPTMPMSGKSLSVEP